MSDYELSEQFGSGGGIKTISINKSIPLIPADNIPNIELFLDLTIWKTFLNRIT